MADGRRFYWRTGTDAFWHVGYMPRQIGRVELALAKQVGYVPQDEGL
jgi:hypothetical protein